MKKIAIIVNQYHPFIGGTESLAKSLVEKILCNFYEIEIITNPNLSRNKQNYNYKINEINLSDENGLNTIIKDNKYDCCIFFADLHSAHLNIYNLTCNKNICILNIDERTYSVRNAFPKAINNLKKFTKVISYTKDGVANRFLRENNINYVYIQNFSRDILLTEPNPIFEEKIKGLFENQDRKLILYLAAMEERKNQHYVITKLVEQSHLREFNWLFVGPQNNIAYTTKCIEEIKKYNLPVKFVKGFDDVDKLNTLYQISDLVCLTSIAEGMPLVLLEGLSANKPWVSTPVGGVPSSLNDTNTGVILSKVDFSGVELYDSLKQALKITNNNPRDLWSSFYREDLVLEKYKNLIREII